MPKKPRINLIELLVICTLGIFATMIMIPAIGHARGRSKTEMCLMNLKVLQTGWFEYQQDYNGTLIGGSTYFGGSRSSKYRWVECPLYEDTDNPEIDPVPPSNLISLENRLNGIRAGKLYPYIQQKRLYHCPADRHWITQQMIQYQVYRSYAIAGAMNGEETTLFSPRTIYFPDGTQKQLVGAEKYQDIKNPSTKYVFVEEEIIDASIHSAQPYNLGSFILMSNGNYWSWWDIPAAWHNNASTLSFADGHVEMHRWTDLRTIKAITGDESTARIQPENADLDWMNRGHFACD